MSNKDFNVDLVTIIEEIKNQKFDVSTVSKDPFEQFAAWYNDAERVQLYLPHRMYLSTVSVDVKPSGRSVLMKRYDLGGFVFYTNYESRKGKELGDIPFAALAFTWAELEREVRIEGSVDKISEQESDAYFQSRPKHANIVALASKQSQVLEDRELLEKKVDELEEKYRNEAAIDRPDNWGGYIVKPFRFEFWKGMPDRFHIRVEYQSQQNGTWLIQSLYP